MRNNRWRACQAWILAAAMGVSSLSGAGCQIASAAAQTSASDSSTGGVQTQSTSGSSRIVQAQETKDTETAGQTPFWQQDNNAPMFYGATQITMPVGMMTTFDIKDTRFRVFARDYEDGDLTPQIECSGTVDPMTVGDYELRYQVQDSAGQSVSLTVPVHVRDWADYQAADSSQEYKVYEKTASQDGETTGYTSREVSGYQFNYRVERTLYELPSDYYQWIRGMKRADKEDRQQLGIYLPAGSSFTVYRNRTDHDIRFDLLTDDSENDSCTWRSAWNDKAVTYTNEHDCSSVPFAQTYQNSTYAGSGDDWDHTSVYDIEYDVDTPALPYYHYKDDEESFRADWRSSGHRYSVLEGEGLTMLVPLRDEPYMTGTEKNCFDTLDHYLEHYLSIVTHYKKWVGVSTKPDDIRDLCVDSRQFIRPDAHGAGLAAYYTGMESKTYHKSWISFNGNSVKMFFEMGWMELHEIGHGYQGDINGNNTMDLTEVTNNILAHYYQSDKSLYPFDESWLGGNLSSTGAFSKIEEGIFKDLDSVSDFRYGDFKTRLYFYLLLFDRFEGVDTYAKIRTWHRHNMALNTSGVDPQEILARAMADIYHVNIIPYLEAWKIPVNDSWAQEVNACGYPRLYMMDQLLDAQNCETVRAYRSAHQTYDFCDYVNGINVDGRYSEPDLIHQIISDEEISEIFGRGSEYYNVSCTREGKAVMAGEQARLVSGARTYTVEIDKDGVAEFYGVYPGTYELWMPLDYSQTQSVPLVTLSQNDENNKEEYYKYKVNMVEVKYYSKQYGSLENSLNSLYRQFSNDPLFAKNPYYKLDVRQKFMSNFYQLPGSLKEKWKEKAAQINPDLNYLQAPESLTLTKPEQWSSDYLETYFTERIWYKGREWSSAPSGELILDISPKPAQGDYMIPYEYTMDNGNQIYGYLEVSYEPDDGKTENVIPTAAPTQTPSATASPDRTTTVTQKPSQTQTPSQTQQPGQEQTATPAGTPGQPDTPAPAEQPSQSATQAPDTAPTPVPTLPPDTWLFPTPDPDDSDLAEPVDDDEDEDDDDLDSIAVISGVRRLSSRKVRVRVSTADVTVTVYHKQGQTKKKASAVCRGKKVTITCRKKWKKGDTLILVLKKDGYATSRVKVKG